MTRLARVIVNGITLGTLLNVLFLLIGACRALLGQVAPVVPLVHGEAAL